LPFSDFNRAEASSLNLSNLKKIKGFSMTKDSTYGKLDLKVKEFEKAAIKHKQIKERLEESEEKHRSERVSAEKALRENEQRYRNLFENAPIGIGVSDMDGNIIDFNDGALKPFGYTRQNIAQLKNIENLYYAPEVRKAILAKFKKQGFIDTVEVQFKHKNGRPVNCLMSLRSIRYKGKPCIQAILQDITKLKIIEKMLNESRQRFLALVETTSDWIWEVDKNGVYTYSNQKVADILGYAPFEIIGKKPFDFMPSDEAKRIGKIFKTISDARRSFSALENRAVHKEGHQVILETSGVPVFGGKDDLLGYRGIDRDITDRKKIESELHQAHNQLESKVKNRTAQLSESNLKLEKEIKARKGVEKQLRHHIAFENLITCISTNFIHLPFDAIDEGINNALYDLGEFADIDRCFVLEFSEDRSTFKLSYQWCADHIPVLVQDHIQQLSKTDTHSRAMEKIRRGKVIYFPRIRDLLSKPEVSKTFHEIATKKLQVKSLLHLPMKFGESVVGILGIDSVKEEKTWSNENITLFNIIGEIFANLIQRKQTEKALREREMELERKTENLEEMNAALRILLKKREDDRVELEEKMLSNVKQLIEPYIAKLKQSSLNERQKTYLKIIQTNVDDIISPFARKLSSVYFKLTPKEIQIADLIKQGKTNKEIAEALSSALKTIEFHRANIRKKFGLRKSKANLRTHLLSLQ
jgi:PAS domain S-box-containing protein